MSAPPAGAFAFLVMQLSCILTLTRYHSAPNKETGMEYERLVGPDLAVERQRVWVAFMAAAIQQYVEAFHAAAYADEAVAEWDKRFAPPVNLVAVHGDAVNDDRCSICGCAKCSHRD